jgi:hypothetical protein
MGLLDREWRLLLEEAYSLCSIGRREGHQARPQAHLNRKQRHEQSGAEHVPAYSHSNRWIGVSGAWGDEWVGAGESPGGQSVRNRCQGR